jgi:hypothetical protein
MIPVWLPILAAFAAGIDITAGVALLLWLRAQAREEDLRREVAYWTEKALEGVGE